MTSRRASPVRYGVHDGIGQITFARPERGNRFDQETLEALSSAVGQATSDGETGLLRCLVLNHEGAWFSTGGDLESLGAERAGTPAFIRGATIPLNAAVTRLARLDAPVIAAIDGPAIGAAVALVAAADIVIAGQNAAFMAGYHRIGMTPDGGISWFLPRRVGTRRATDYFLRNRTWNADEACRYGLVNEVVPSEELAEHVDQIATELAAGPTAAFAVTRALLLSAWDQPLEQQLELEARELARASRTDDGWHGISAALGRQKAVFRGR